MDNPAPTLAPKKAAWYIRLGLSSIRQIVVIAVLVLITAAAVKAGLRLDLSASHRFSIDPRLERLVQDLKDPIEIIGVWPNGFEGLTDPLKDRVIAVARTSKKITWRRIDPTLDQPELEAAQKKFGEISSGNLYVVREGRPAYRIPVVPALEVLFQRELGAALVALTSAKPVMVQVLQGHGELRPDGSPDDGCGVLLRRLAGAGFQVAMVNEADIEKNGAHLDPDALVLVPGPTAPLGEKSLAALRRHLIDGGGLMILADDRIPADLAVLLRQRGILIGPGFFQGIERGDLGGLFDPSRSSLQSTVLYSERSAGRKGYEQLLAGSEQILRDRFGINRQVIDSGRELIFPRSSPILALEPTLLEQSVPDAAAKYVQVYGTPAFTTQPLIGFKPGTAWREVWKPNVTVPENLSASTNSFFLAWAANYEAHPNSIKGQRSARLVVYGSRQAASTLVWQDPRFANDLALIDAARWTSQRDAAVPIPEADLKRFYVQTGKTGMWVLFVILIGIIPSTCIGIAILTWWERRR